VKAHHIFVFIVVVLLSLGSLSALFPEEGILLGGRRLYFPVIEDVLSEDDYSQQALRRVRAVEESLRRKRGGDAAYVDSLGFYTQFFRESPSRIYLPQDDWYFLNDFFRDLDSCRARQEIVHILHYGDSQIEGDRITGVIRRRLQETFGGEGPGLLPVVQVIPAEAVVQSASENIERYIVSGMQQNRASHARYGVLGQFGAVDGKSSVSIAARNWKMIPENTKWFETIRLFVGKEKRFKVRLAGTDLPAVKEEVEGTAASPLKVYTWRLSEPINKFSLHFSGRGEVYGVAVDGSSGVAVDNIPFRGGSGTFFSTMDSTLMASMLKELNVKLIILEFGGNVLPSIRGEKSIKAYQNRLVEQIAWLRGMDRERKILLIGPSDMSTKVNGKFRTYTYLEPLVEAMKAAALDNGAAFWNMYEVMGGHNSMIEWVNHSPALAATDYVHFTPRGAERIATLFCETLMVYYDYYRFINEHNTPTRK
jgi:lysophospholipase L1-like esterase